MIFDVSHRTTFAYREPVLQSQHLVHLAPRESPHQRVLRHGLLIEPAPSAQMERLDYFGNGTAILTVDEEHVELVIHARSRVEVRAPRLPILALSAPWEGVASRARRNTSEADVGVLQFVSASRHTRIDAEVLDYARPSFTPHRPILEAALHLTRRIYDDFAHLAIAGLRGLGLPARYVSGYLLTYPPPGMEKLQGADASHAWISVWAPEVGWVDFDPTNGVIPTEEHITVAYGRDYDDVSPVSGVLLGGSRQTMSVAVDVTVAG